MSQLDIRDVTLAYDSFIVTKDLSFSVNEGEYLCIVGENGSGKSTLIKAILGLKHIKNGTIIFGDGLKQTEIGYLPQHTSDKLDFPATIGEVVISGTISTGKLFPTKEDKYTAKKNMELLGIDNLKNRSFCEVSGGQRQRALLARALCATKKLILLDEPTAALDPDAANELYSLIKRINRERNITVIMVSHDMRSIDYATHVLHMGSTNIFTTRESYLRRKHRNV